MDHKVLFGILQKYNLASICIKWSKSSVIVFSWISSICHFRDFPKLYPEYFQNRNSKTKKNQKLQFAFVNAHFWSICIIMKNAEFPRGKILKSKDTEIPANWNNDNLRNAWHLIPTLNSLLWPKRFRKLVIANCNYDV